MIRFGGFLLDYDNTLPDSTNPSFLAKKRKESLLAGTFTHWMVVEEALRQCNEQPGKHPQSFPAIFSQKHFVSLGAVSPDYPYLTDLLNKWFKTHSWADRMHYENTGAFVQHGMERLLSLSGDTFSVCQAWLAGYASHVITDSVIHPVVQAIVGPYIFNSTEHRHCEMVQDAFIFHDIKGQEISYTALDGTDYCSMLKKCSDPEDPEKIHPDLCQLWSETLKACHPGAGPYFDRIVPDKWHENFISRIEGAADPICICRNFEEKENIAYKKTPDISSDEWERFYGVVRLPGNKTGGFKQDVFEKAVDAVISTWDKFLSDVEKKIPVGCAEYLKNWNLDTGVDEDRPHFW